MHRKHSGCWPNPPLSYGNSGNARNPGEILCILKITISIAASFCNGTAIVPRNFVEWMKSVIGKVPARLPTALLRTTSRKFLILISRQNFQSRRRCSVGHARIYIRVQAQQEEAAVLFRLIINNFVELQWKTLTDKTIQNSSSSLKTSPYNRSPRASALVLLGWSGMISFQ